MRYQSRHSRRRQRRLGPVSLLAAGVLGLGSVALGAAPALAADTPKAGPHTVIFTGTCAVGGIVYSSVKPTVEGDAVKQLSVPSGTKITIVNKVDKLTGGTPQLSITGHGPVGLESDSYATYRADGGPVSIGLDPKCPLGALGYRDYKALTLNVTPKTSSDSPSGSSGTQHSGDADHNGGPTSPGAGPTTPGHSATAPADEPAAGDSPSVPKVHKPVARGAVPSAAAAPGAGSGTSGGGGETSGTALPAPPAAQPQPVADSGPSGTTSVLALLAAVCLAGVGAAAVHTVMARRRSTRAASA